MDLNRNGLEPEWIGIGMDWNQNRLEMEGGANVDELSHSQQYQLYISK